MRFNIVLIILIASVIPAVAQGRFGVEAGLNVSHGFETAKTKAGFNIGVTGEYGFHKHWFVDASLKLSSQPTGDDYAWAYSNNKPVPDQYLNGSSFRRITDYTPYYLALPVRIGYRMALSSKAKVSLSVGPMIGLGLMGKGSVRTIPLDASGQKETFNKTNNVFNCNDAACFSSSRFEYGADAKLAVEFMSHYCLGLNYSLIHIAGDKTAVDNVGVFSVNVGYKF